MSNQRKTCLVVSYGPVPTPQYQTVEGGGMRAWGLAKGLYENGIDVTVAINASFPQDITSHEDIKLINWSQDERFTSTLNTFDSVIVSYCMGSDSVFIADHINDDVQLILDVYVPIYVEVSARESNDIDNEYVSYMNDVTRYNHVLKRGDYFLCASDTQKIYYTGILSSLGVINPRSYREDRIILTPFGIHDDLLRASNNPYKELGVQEGDFLVLWFGGLYPWFKVDEFLKSVKRLSSNKRIKFAIVGGKNPFNPNPDFSRQYEHAVTFAKDNGLYNKSLIFVDWVDFDDRINWYKRADLVISINNPGEENTFSWRTRVMDYVWAELPILTNAGDPLSEQLLESGAAIRLDDLSEQSITKAVLSLKENTNTLKEVKNSLVRTKKSYLWEKLTKGLALKLAEGLHPYAKENSYRNSLGATDPSKSAEPAPDKPSPSLGRPVDFSRRAFSYARKKGLRRSAGLAYRLGRAQFAKKASVRKTRRYIFISHPIDNTGAPLVLLKMVEEFAKKFGPSNVRLLAPDILPHQLKRLKENRILVDKAALALGDRMVDLQLALDNDDFVLMNTLAVYSNYRGYILRALESGRIKHAYWFIHEDVAQLPLVARDLTDGKEIKPISKLANQKKLTIVVPSKKVAREYEELWKIDKVQVLPLHVDVPKKYKKPRPASEYSKLNFLLSGTPADSRKGQVVAITALYSFLKTYYESSPEKYRDFNLTLIGIGDDYVSQQIRSIGKLLGKRLKIYPSVPYDDALELSSKCNSVICCSLNETFALYVAEGMYTGHVVLRNDSAGMEEQLVEGKNGYFIDNKNIDQFVSVIEKLASKKMSNAELREMGAVSQTIIAPYANNSYLDILEKHK